MAPHTIALFNWERIDVLNGSIPLPKFFSAPIAMNIVLLPGAGSNCNSSRVSLNPQRLIPQGDAAGGFGRYFRGFGLAAIGGFGFQNAGSVEAKSLGT